MRKEVLLNPKKEILEQKEYNYDFEGRLVEVRIQRENLIKTVRYEYDALGARIAREEEWAIEAKKLREKIYYLNDLTGPLSQVLQTYDNENRTISSFLYGLSRICGLGEGTGKSFFYLHDTLGSVVGLTDEGGAPVAKYSYEEFGVPSPSTEAQMKSKLTGLVLTYGFTGEDYDPMTNLLFLRARYYKPEIGRFITEDIFAGFPTLPISQNRYVYCHNSSTTYIDPSGRIVWVVAIFAIGGVIGGLTNVATYYLTAPPDQRDGGDYLPEFGKGLIFGGVGALFGAGAAFLAKSIGATAAVKVTVGGIVSGGVSGSVTQLGLNWRQGRPLGEDILVSTIIGAGMGGIAPNIPGLRYVGPAPKISWTRGWGSPLGGYVGPNTYRYHAQQLLSGVMSGIGITAQTIRETFSPERPILFEKGW